MGTRSGDIDPAIVFFMHDKPGYSVDKINQVLTRESGLLGMTEESSDCRLRHRQLRHRRRCQACAGRLHLSRLPSTSEPMLPPWMVAWTPWCSPAASARTPPWCARWCWPTGPVGFKIDKEANNAAVLGGEGPITVEGSRLALVMPTNEELVIARDALSLVG